MTIRRSPLRLRTFYHTKFDLSTPKTVYFAQKQKLFFFLYVHSLHFFEIAFFVCFFAQFMSHFGHSAINSQKKQADLDRFPFLLFFKKRRGFPLTFSSLYDIIHMSFKTNRIHPLQLTEQVDYHRGTREKKSRPSGHAYRSTR